MGVDGLGAGGAGEGVAALIRAGLEGEVVRLRPLEAGDWDALFEAASDPLVWEQHPASDRWREPVFREFFDRALAVGTAFAVIERSSGAIVGSTRYHGLDLARSEVEIGWTFLVRRCWGGRMNREMKRLMIERAFELVETVVLLIGPTNGRSLAAAGRLGARPVGLVETHGRGVGPVMQSRWEFRRGEWAAVRARLMGGD